MPNCISTEWFTTSTMLSRRVLRFELYVSYTNSAKLSTLTTLHGFMVSSSLRTSLRLQLCTKRVWYCLSISGVSVESIVSGHFWRTQNSSAARISSSESSSSFEIRHSNDPNTPRGVHLYLIDFIDITTYDIQLKILFIYSKYQIVHRKSTWICSFDLERTVGVLLFHWNTGAIDIVIWLFQPTFKINQWRT